MERRMRLNTICANEETYLHCYVIWKSCFFVMGVAFVGECGIMPLFEDRSVRSYLSEASSTKKN